jgi:hypothetical protein
LIAGHLEVADGARLMAYTTSGIAVVIVGPAAVEVGASAAAEGLPTLELTSGRIMYRAEPRSQGARAPLAAVLASKAPRVAVEVLIGPGMLCLARTADRAEVALLGDAATPRTQARVAGGAAIALEANQLLTADAAGTPNVAPLPAGWPAERGFDPVAARRLGQSLGVASARESRGGVADRLFMNIILWDRFAAAEHVVPKLQEGRFNPEVRQSMQLALAGKGPTARTEAPKPEPINAANEVPLLSPAAARVQSLRDVGEGVAAIRLNSQAAGLLQQTSSQGLGFRGPRLLAVPGFASGESRTVGPSGLGARR